MCSADARAPARLLVVTSDEGATATLADAARRLFATSRVVFWEFGDARAKPDAVAAVEGFAYDLIVSHVGGLILTADQLRRAVLGAVNVHPAPPEHGGAFGIFCQPVIARQIRSHHGTTVHEMDEQIDHGPIYRVERWDVPEHATITDVATRSFADCRRITLEVLEALAASTTGTRCFAPSDERWRADNRHHTVEDVRRWFAALDPAHPAHAERVPLNHPRATAAPPYFDDL